MAREATPTEYKGITYRSKCEAMFARYLELSATNGSSTLQSHFRHMGHECTFSQHGFAYEPELPLTNWRPDFLTWRWCGVPIILLSNVGWRIIEYKPCQPSGAYLHSFECKAREFLVAIDKSPIISKDRISFSIYFGNPYQHKTDGSGLFDFEPQDHVLFDNSSRDWLGAYVDDLMSYRFDLKNGGDIASGNRVAAKRLGYFNEVTGDFGSPLCYARYLQ